MNYKNLLWKAITSEYPNCKFVLNMNDANILDTINWSKENTVPFDKNRIETKIAELQAAEPMRLLKEERNRRIAEADWRFLSDQTPSQAWIDYRQALRDLPENSTPELDENGQLTNITWPEKPE